MWFFQIYSFLSKVFRALLVPLPFTINFIISLSVFSKKNPTGIDWNWIEYKDQFFWELLSFLRLIIHEYVLSPNLFRLPFYFFHQSFFFLSLQHLYFVRFMQHIFGGKIIVNDKFSNFLVLNWSLLVYGNATNFCVLNCVL